MRKPIGSEVKWAECPLIIATGCWVQVFSLILDSSVGLSAGIQSTGDWVPETLWVRILHSAEKDNLSPFDSKIVCLCQSIEINNKHVYVYVYVCVCVYVSACVCIYIYVCMYVCMYVCVYACMHVLKAITTNIYIARASRKLIDIEVNWADCSLIIGMGYWDEEFSLDPW